jgi:alkenylglycerophosphocholine/alkenylglycerophosphoethanolamine hydrolase
MELGVVACLLLGTLAIVGVETRRPRLVMIGKPAATLVLLLVVGLPPSNRFSWLVAGGLLCSVAGDIALLGEGDREFIIGTAAFLVAHVFYSAAFLGVSTISAGRGLWAPGHFPLPALAVVAASAALVVLLWPRLGKLRGPVAIYAVAITFMVLAAFATWGGPLPRAAARVAAFGSLLFYMSDSSLAWSRFRRPFPHAGLLTLATYWLGQIGIALAARWQG